MALLQEILVPLLAVNDTSLTVVEINFSTGQPVKKGDCIMVFETSKTTYDAEAQSDGYIQYLCEAGHDYMVSEIVAKIFSEAAEAMALPEIPTMGNSRTGFAPGSSATAGISGASANISAATAGIPGATAGISAATAGIPVPVLVPFWEGETLFSQEATRLMESSGINRSVFAGMDFVSKEDVMRVLQPPTIPVYDSPSFPSGPGRNAGQTGLKQPKALPARPVLPVDLSKVSLLKLPSGKRREIEYLEDIQSTGLTSTIHTFVETEGLFLHINRSLKYLKDSLLPVIIYEVSRLLGSYPLLNAYFTGDAIAFYKEVNTGFAIDIEKGLKVLKIDRADHKSIQEIESAIMELSGRYLDEALPLEDLTDITFTITDLSSENVAFFRPLINKMNSAILGVSSIDDKLQRFALSLTFDHRVTEGKLVAGFLKELKDRLESYGSKYHPGLMLDITCFKCFKTLREDLGNTGFARCVTPEGKEGYICQSCLKGF